MVDGRNAVTGLRLGSLLLRALASSNLVFYIRTYEALHERFTSGRMRKRNPL